MHQFHLKATTVLAQSSRSLLHAIKTRLHPVPARTHVFYTLSLNADEEAIGSVPSLWESSVGCLSAPLPSAPNHISLSMLQVPYGMGRTFVSSIPGRPPNQVGRYHSIHKSAATEEYDQSASSYNRAMGEISGASRAEEYPVPEGLIPIVQNMQALLYLSDLAPEGLVKSLDYYYPNSMKAGLIATSTPFVTGHPVTLFSNGKTIKNGAVGIGIFPQFESLSHGFEGLETLSDVLTVTSSQGNLVHTLDGVNPSKLLTDAITSRSATGSSGWALNPKDDDFYLGVLEKNGKNFRKIYTITSGDPKRGSLALDGEESPSKGDHVKLVRRSGADISSAVAHLGKRPKSINFVTSSKEAVSNVDESSDSEATILPGTFLAATENGLLLNRLGEKTWISAVEGGWSSMSWQIPDAPSSTA